MIDIIVDAIAGVAAGIPGETGAKVGAIFLVVCVIIIGVILLTR